MKLADSPSEKRREEGLVNSKIYSCVGVCGASVGCDEVFESVQEIKQNAVRNRICGCFMMGVNKYGLFVLFGTAQFKFIEFIVLPYWFGDGILLYQIHPIIAHAVVPPCGVASACPSCIIKCQNHLRVVGRNHILFCESAGIVGELIQIKGFALS